MPNAANRILSYFTFYFRSNHVVCNKEVDGAVVLQNSTKCLPGTYVGGTHVHVVLPETTAAIVSPASQAASQVVRVEQSLE